MNRKFLMLPLLLCAFASHGQESAPHQKTTSPPNGRYEIIQSALAAKWTFRLDRYTGRVWQMVKTPDDDNTWEEMPVLEQNKTQSPEHPHFQIFSSGLAARHTFLIDTDTGKTWQPVNTKQKSSEGTEYEITIWQPFVQ